LRCQKDKEIDREIFYEWRHDYRKKKKKSIKWNIVFKFKLKGDLDALELKNFNKL